MKKLVIVTSACAMIFAYTVVVRAEDGQTNPPRPPKIEQIKKVEKLNGEKKIDKALKDIKERGGDIKDIDKKINRILEKNGTSTIGSSTATSTRERLERLREQRGEKVEKMVGKGFGVIDMFEKRLALFDETITKIQSKISELTSKGIDASKATAALEKAKAANTAAKTELEKVRSALEKATGDKIDKTVAQSMRESLKVVEKQTVQAHKYLVESTKILKEIIKRANKNGVFPPATTTPPSSTTTPATTTPATTTPATTTPATSTATSTQ